MDAERVSVVFIAFEISVVGRFMDGRLAGRVAEAVDALALAEALALAVALAMAVTLALSLSTPASLALTVGWRRQSMLVVCGVPARGDGAVIRRGFHWLRRFE